jgi:hypothetical protein
MGRGPSRSIYEFGGDRLSSEKLEDLHRADLFVVSHGDSLMLGLGSRSGPSLQGAAILNRGGSEHPGVEQAMAY